MLLAIAAVLLTALGAAVGFSPALAGSVWLWVAFGLSQAPLAARALLKLHKEEDLRGALAPRWGDISLGMGSALLLLGATWLGRLTLVPAGAPRESWLWKIFLQIGEPALLQQNLVWVVLGILLLAALQELAWRGLVFPVLEEKLGTRRAWPLTGLLFGLSFAPSLLWLRTASGPNGLIVGAALLGGLVWSYLAARTRRLMPSILSHAAFVWFVVMQFRLLLTATNFSGGF